MRFAFLALFLSACGSAKEAPPTPEAADEFQGTFSGEATQRITCAGSSGETNTAGQISVTITKTGANQISAAFIIPSDNIGGTTTCGSLPLDVSTGHAASSDAAGCVLIQDPPLDVFHRITKASLAFDDGALSVDLSTAVEIDTVGGSPVTCTGALAAVVGKR